MRWLVGVRIEERTSTVRIAGPFTVAEQDGAAQLAANDWPGVEHMYVWTCEPPAEEVALHLAAGGSIMGRYNASIAAYIKVEEDAGMLYVFDGRAT